MNNLIINWRFGARHLQVVRWSDWPSYLRARRSPVSFFVNEWHLPGSTARDVGRGAPDWHWLEFYNGAGYVFVAFGLLALAIGLAL